MAENNNTPVNVEAAISQAVGKVMGRKFGIAVVGMWMLASVKAPAWMVWGLAIAALACQLVLDAIERFWLKRDIPDNGNGTPAEKAVTT